MSDLKEKAYERHFEPSTKHTLIQEMTSHLGRKNFLRIVVVGINHWDDLTFPFWKQLTGFNPDVEVVIIDNASEPEYPTWGKIRHTEVVGYGAALNSGTWGRWDWLLCCNNDCTCEGKIDVSGFRDDTVYGNAWKFDYEWSKQLGLPAVVDSAYLLIPRKVWDTIGGFDERMDAAFEEVDLCLRAIRAGFRIDVAELPITHLNKHTRYELDGYQKRWDATSKVFRDKYGV